MKTALALACLLLTSAFVQTVFAQQVKSELKLIEFSTLDTNKDGKLSMAEARADADLSASFEMLDINHDGFLSPAEFQAWPRAAKVKDGSAPNPSTAPSGSAGAQHMPQG